jgi:hypothetical protein
MKDRKIEWCGRCRHAITPVRGGAWGHVSDDDWAGPDSECMCSWRPVPCVPERQRRQPFFTRTPMGSPYVIYDEVQLFSERWTEVPCVPERQRRQP